MNRSYRTGILLFFLPVLFTGCVQRKLAKKHRYMERSYVALKKSLNEAEVSIINDSVKVQFPNNVMFAFAKASVLPKFLPVVARLASVLDEHKKTGVLIIGHTDSLGEVQTNMFLSTQRADSARALLIFYGVDINRLNVWGLGKRMPISSNATEEGRAKNRRVEFVVLYRYRNTDGRKD